MVFQNFLYFCGLGLSLAAPLGPVNAEIIKVGLSRPRGWVLGLFTGIGATSADFILATSILFIAAQFVKSLVEIDLVLFGLLLVNFLILTYIGISAIRADPGEMNVRQDENLDTSNGVGSVKIEKAIVNDLVNDYDNVEEGKIGQKNLDTGLLEHKVHNKISNSQESSFKKLILKQSSIGFILVLTSPWSYVWWVSFGPNIVANYKLETAGDIFLVITFFLSGILLWVTLLTFGIIISSTFASQRVQRGITIVSAIFILIFAFSLLIEAFYLLITGNRLQIIQTGINWTIGLVIPD